MLQLELPQSSACYKGIKKEVGGYLYNGFPLVRGLVIYKLVTLFDFIVFCGDALNRKGGFHASYTTCALLTPENMAQI